jgi:hypothetical protein
MPLVKQKEHIMEIKTLTAWNPDALQSPTLGGNVIEWRIGLWCPEVKM